MLMTISCLKTTKFGIAQRIEWFVKWMSQQIAESIEVGNVLSKGRQKVHFPDCVANNLMCLFDNAVGLWIFRVLEQGGFPFCLRICFTFCLSLS